MCALDNGRTWRVDPDSKRLRNKFRKYVPGLFAFAKVLGLGYSRRSFLRESGYMVSAGKKRPCRADGSPIPWMNYPMIKFLEDRLNKDMTLFEYGSGNSTLFFAERVGRVVSVECEKAWHDEIAGSMPGNVDLRLCEPYDPGAYVAMIGQDGDKYDVVVVDAEERPRCLLNAPNWLSYGGVILLDDASREAYMPAQDALIEQGFRKLEFEGLKPGGIRAYRTTVFYRDGNVLGL